MSTSQVTEQQPTELLRTATEFAKDGALEQARDRLTALLEIEPHHEIANGMLAAVYAELKDTDQAVAYYHRALAIDPANPLARFQLGLIQLEARQPQAALETFEYGLTRSIYGPNEFLVRFYSGVALLQLDRADDARIALQQSQEFMPTNHLLYSELLALLIKLDTTIS